MMLPDRMACVILVSIFIIPVADGCIQATGFLETVCGGPNIPPTADGAMDRIKNTGMMNNLNIFRNDSPFRCIYFFTLGPAGESSAPTSLKIRTLPCVPIAFARYWIGITNGHIGIKRSFLKGFIFADDQRRVIDDFERPDADAGVPGPK